MALCGALGFQVNGFLKVRYFLVFHAMDRALNSGYYCDGSTGSYPYSGLRSYCAVYPCIDLTIAHFGSDARGFSPRTRNLQ